MFRWIVGAACALVVTAPVSAQTVSSDTPEVSASEMARRLFATLTPAMVDGDLVASEDTEDEFAFATYRLYGQPRGSFAGVCTADEIDATFRPNKGQGGVWELDGTYHTYTFVPWAELGAPADPEEWARDETQEVLKQRTSEACGKMKTSRMFFRLDPRLNSPAVPTARSLVEALGQMRTSEIDRLRLDCAADFKGERGKGCGIPTSRLVGLDIDAIVLLEPCPDPRARYECLRIGFGGWSTEINGLYPRLVIDVGYVSGSDEVTSVSVVGVAGMFD